MIVAHRHASSPENIHDRKSRHIGDITGKPAIFTRPARHSRENNRDESH
ncbi:hypothetical protein BIFBIF_00806 [Bifidobacterium bifidum ATCC 29521 = JCM 1255 = DSM 20456]|nr:hypothetical protein BIFBIF_00806 [Bifidobacterium bifidum ATCC 29521 = JCM 1255 = DSM 20456]